MRGGSKLQKFLARQPIFNRHRVAFGYELLFRSSLENFFSHTQPDIAAATTADDLFLFGVGHLTQGRRAFLNCTRDFLVRDYGALLPKDRVVIEVLENVRIDEEVIAACQRLKQAGYLIALDDFKYAPEWEPLIALADFIKVDVLVTPPEEQSRLAKKFSRTGVQLVAEKVETYEVFDRTLRLGYALSGIFLQQAADAVSPEHSCLQIELSTGAASGQSGGNR